MNKNYFKVGDLVEFNPSLSTHFGIGIVLKIMGNGYFYTVYWTKERKLFLETSFSIIKLLIKEENVK